jgi:uncharacterized protein (TIGR01777 family)
MSVAIIGSSGLVGEALQEFFRKLNQKVVLLKRESTGEYAFHPSDFSGVETVINLAGSSISSRWTKQVKQEIKDSRIKTTKALSEVLQKLQAPPKVVINASAIGYYGDGKDKTLTESSPQGEGFLSQVVEEWEKALQIPRVRTVFARFGVILSPKGGALKKMLPPFKMGLGGPIGSGKQFMSWIAIEDVVGAIHHMMFHDELKGAVNVVAPHPVRNEEFTQVLGKVLHRPAVLPLPEFAVRMLFGEMGDALLLSSTRVEPKRLLETGYPFIYPELEQALAAEITYH